MATLAKTIYRSGSRLSQLVRERNVAIYQVFKPQVVGPVYETVLIVGEQYPSMYPSKTGNRRFVTHRLYLAQRTMSVWLHSHSPVK